jgi:hypothetical protein
MSASSTEYTTRAAAGAIALTRAGSDRPPRSAFRLLDLGQRPAHWPVLRPVTWFGLPSESPTCGAGELPAQFRLPWIVLLTYSFASGSSVSVTLPSKAGTGTSLHSQPLTLERCRS